MNRSLLAVSRGARRVDSVRWMIVGAALLSGLSAGQSARADDGNSANDGAEYIFIGEVGDPSTSTDDAIKRVNLSTGEVQVFATTSFTDGLNGPMGLIFNGGELIVSNQNFGATNGDVLRFDGRTGAFINFLVSTTARGAPYAPQGIVFGGASSGEGNGYQPDQYYVAEFGTRGDSCIKGKEGDIRVYSESGASAGVLNHGQFKPNFYPRGVVFGPDGMLYVTARGCPYADDGATAQKLAYLLRFNPYTRKLVDVIATNDTVEGFHRPEGLVFDSNGYLWVTSFRDATNSEDVDRILKFDVKTGKVIDAIPLSDKASDPRAYAQAIVFGPGGKLFVPISGGAPETAGQLRRYDIKTKQYNLIVKENSAGGGLIAPWFAIFRSSDPATLKYRNR